MRSSIAILILATGLAGLLYLGFRDEAASRRIANSGSASDFGEVGPGQPVAPPLPGPRLAPALATTKRVARYERDHDITISTDASELPARRGWGVLHGEAAAKRELDRYLPLLMEELEKYPSRFLRRSGLKSILLCKALAVDDDLRAAVPDFETATLYLDVERGDHSRDYQRCVIHHDYFHILDKYADGLVYEDEGWVALNRPGFSYGSHGMTPPRGLWSGAMTGRYPGFLTHYATTALEEDKAEVFAHLMVHHGKVMRRAAEDAVLAAKVARIKEEARAVSEEMNDEFWQRLAAR